MQLHKHFIKAFLTILLSATLCLAADPLASRIRTDTTNFNNNLSASDTDVQKALETINDKTIVSSESDPVYSAWDKDYDDLTNTPTIPSDTAE